MQMIFVDKTSHVLLPNFFLIFRLDHFSSTFLSIGVSKHKKLNKFKFKIYLLNYSAIHYMIFVQNQDLDCCDYKVPLYNSIIQRNTDFTWWK
jgi:hypothetical protein